MADYIYGHAPVRASDSRSYPLFIRASIHPTCDDFGREQWRVDRETSKRLISVCVIHARLAFTYIFVARMVCMWGGNSHACRAQSSGW